MRLDRLALSGFRNYDRQDVAFQNGVNILVGENAQGKTNILEAIFLLTGSRSWRAARRSELIRIGSENARIEAEIFSRERPFEINMALPPVGRGVTTVNGVRIKKQNQLSDVLRCVLFAPEDLSLLRDGAAARRRFLDTALCQLRPRYAELLSEYQRLIEHKTRLLRDEEKRESMLAVLPDFNERIAVIGSAVIGYRARFTDLLVPVCQSVYKDISGGREQLSMRYSTLSTIEDPTAPQEKLITSFFQHLDSHYEAELRLGQCLSGPHKDDLILEIDGKPCRSFASQGQTRSAALAMKFAERELFFRDSGEYPVLLLDDVLSELDVRRQSYVVEHTPGGQAIITCCEDTGRFQSGHRLFVENGKVL